MLMWPDCVPCIDEMISTVAATLLDERAVAGFMQEVRRLPAMIDPSGPYRSPEVARDVWTLLVALTGEADPLADVKRRQNELALGMYETALQSAFESADPFGAAVKLSAAGNILAAMVDVAGGPKDDLLERLAALHVELERLETFRKRVAQARRIVYFGDNCGEIVFDRLLLEVIEASADVQVTFVARNMPALNDATVADALAVGMDAVATVIDNGLTEALPGTALARGSEQMRRLVADADLIICKGGANYEMLDDEPSLAGKTTFILFGKCDPLCGAHAVEQGELIVFNH